MINRSEYICVRVQYFYREKQTTKIYTFYFTAKLCPCVHVASWRHAPCGSKHDPLHVERKWHRCWNVMWVQERGTVYGPPPRSEEGFWLPLPNPWRTVFPTNGPERSAITALPGRRLSDLLRPEACFMFI